MKATPGHGSSTDDHTRRPGVWQVAAIAVFPPIVLFVVSIAVGAGGFSLASSLAFHVPYFSVILGPLALAVWVLLAGLTRIGQVIVDAGDDTFRRAVGTTVAFAVAYVAIVIWFLAAAELAAGLRWALIGCQAAVAITAYYRAVAVR